MFTNHADKETYYLGTIIDYPENQMVGGKLGFTPLGDSNIYSEKNIPQKITFTNQAGAGLEISRKFLPNYINCKVNLNSEKGKRISLSDSPKSDAVLIRNEHGDGIVITSKENDIHADRSIEVKSKGLQQYVCFQSGMNLYVIEGKDLNIENFSTGANANVNAGDNGRFGNINIKSHNADINITGKGSNSNVFITTPKARVEIKSDGSVLIDSVGDIRMQSLGNIELKSTAGNISMEALNINMKSTLNTSIEAQVNFAAKGSATATLTTDSPTALVKCSVESGINGAVPIDPAGVFVPLMPLLPKEKTKTDYGD